jgi:hypothetical protein
VTVIAGLEESLNQYIAILARDFRLVTGADVSPKSIGVEALFVVFAMQVNGIPFKLEMNEASDTNAFAVKRLGPGQELDDRSPPPQKPRPKAQSLRPVLAEYTVVVVEGPESLLGCA